MNAPTNQPFEQLSTADQQMASEIANQLFAHQNFAFVVVNLEWEVTQASSNLTDFGFPYLADGVDVTDFLDVLVGLDPTTSIDLPIVLSPTEQPVRILCLPQNESLTIIISDAKNEYDRRQLLQQKANENEILLETQNKLLADIERAQRELEEKNGLLNEASRLQNIFMGGVSHEFRTPLTSITGFSELLIKNFESQRPELTNEIEQLNAIRRGARHLISLVENLLDHGRYDSDEISLNIKSVDIRALFDDVISVLEPLASKKSIQLNFEARDLPQSFVQIDDSKLRQCLFNIIGNAIKFTSQGKVTVGVSYQSQMLEVTVEDTGEGIAPEDISRVSTPFFQASESDKSGAGLGLSITQRIIELMGGELDLKSTLGEGTRVCFSVYAVCDERPIMKSEAQQAQIARILLAEDDPDISDLLKSQLEEAGYDVECAQNGHEAIAQVNQHLFDLVLMDLHMPLLDGYEATSAIKKTQPNLPIIALTASSISQIRNRLEKANFDGFLNKPVRLSEIVKLANNLSPHG